MRVSTALTASIEQIFVISAILNCLQVQEFTCKKQAFPLLLFLLWLPTLKAYVAIFRLME